MPGIWRLRRKRRTSFREINRELKVAPYGYSLFVLRALVSTILGNLPITLSCTSLEPIEIKFWEIKLPF